MIGDEGSHDVGGWTLVWFDGIRVNGSDSHGPYRSKRSCSRMIFRAGAAGCPPLQPIGRQRPVGPRPRRPWGSRALLARTVRTNGAATSLPIPTRWTGTWPRWRAPATATSPSPGTRRRRRWGCQSHCTRRPKTGSAGSSQCRPGQAQCNREPRDPASEQGNVGSRKGNVGAGANGDSNIGTRERRSVIARPILVLRELRHCSSSTASPAWTHHDGHEIHSTHLFVRRPFAGGSRSRSLRACPFCHGYRPKPVETCPPEGRPDLAKCRFVHGKHPT
jgi:hypothetical protein